jgi:two-component system, cell cycle response regulator CpdR
MVRILLAEDEAATRDLVRRALEAEGHSVEVMESGSDALEFMGRAPAQFQLLVSDVNMPGMDGFELAAKARALNPKLAVVLMSGLIEQLERAKSMANMGYITLSKPFTLDQVRASVRAALAS